jgi:hypothetical protein
MACYWRHSAAWGVRRNVSLMKEKRFRQLISENSAKESLIHDCFKTNYPFTSEWSLFEAYKPSTDQEIPRSLWYLKFRLRVLSSSLMVPILSHLNPVHTLVFHFSKIRFKIISHLYQALPYYSLTSGIPTKILYTFIILIIKSVEKQI